MADCCQELQREVALLRQEIAGLQRVDENRIIRESVKQSVLTLDPKIIAFGAVATGASSVAGQALSLARLIASGLAALRAVIAGIAAALASVEVLVAGLVTAVAAIGYLIISVNELKGAVGQLRDGLGDVRTLATKALGAAIDAGIRANNAMDEAKGARFAANLAREIADAARREAITAREEANKAIGKANLANDKADEATKRANAAIGYASNAFNKANDAIARSNNAYDKAIDASGKANDATNKANDAIARSNNAYDRATTASNKADEATRKANNATDEANYAVAQANLAITGVNTLNNKVADTQRQLPPISNTANQANTTANKAYDEVIRYGVTIRNYNPQIIQPKIYNDVIRQVNNAVPISIEQSIANNKVIFDRIAQQNNQALQSQFNDVIARNKAEIDRIYNSTVPQTRSNTDRISNLEKQVSNSAANPANTLSPAINTRISNLEQSSREQERVNQEGITILKNIQSSLPSIPAGVAAAIIPAIPNPATIQSATRTAICDSTKPGGCLGNPLNNIRNGQNNLLQKLDLGLQAGQGALLNSIHSTTNIINRKLGAEIPGFGIGGKLSNFVNWAFADRVMAMVTMLAAVHNVFQLSTQIQNTFFSSIDNILQIGALIGNPDGTGNIDSKQFVGESLDKFFSGIFGATEWTAVKTQWKAYSTIASTSAQAFNNLREIHNDSQELLNLVRSDTAELGNALVDEGLIGEDNWEYKDPKKKIKSKALGRLQRMGQGLEALDNKLEAIEQVTSTLLNIANTAKEIKDNTEEINKAFTEANKAAQLDRNAKIEGVELPNFSLEDLF